MANRYWVGGSGSWDTISTTNWSTSSGGASGASAPTSSDNVFFDAGSDSGTSFSVLLSGSVCNNITISNLDFVMTLSGSSLTVSGSLSYPSTNFNNYVSNYTFNATTTGNTITSNGIVFGNIIFNGSLGSWQLQDALTTTNSSSVTLSRGTLNLNDKTLTVGAFISSTGNPRSIAFGTIGSIVINSSIVGTVLSMAQATNFTFTGTSNITAALTQAMTFNFGSSGGATSLNRLNINLTSGSVTPTFTGSFRQIDFTGSTANIGLKSISCHGFTLASGGLYTGTSFTTIGDGTLTYTGKSISTLDINTAGITTTLADDGQNATTTLSNGTLNLAGFTLTSTTAQTSTTAPKNLTFNGGTLIISGGGITAWNNAGPTNFTTTAGTGTGTISMTAASAKTFIGGGSTYNCTLNQGGAGALTITGSNTFDNITNTVQPASVLFTAGTTNTFLSDFSLSGTTGNLITIGSVTNASHTLSKASGTVSVSYCSISNSSATGGATWNATGITNVDASGGGTNTGWYFGISVASRITSTGVLSISGEFDEVTQNTIGLTPTKLYSSEFDEFTIQGVGGGLTKRETSIGKIQVTGQFDEYNRPYA